MPHKSNCSYVLLLMTLLLGTSHALADSDYERGYREGYRQGRQDGEKMSTTNTLKTERSNSSSSKLRKHRGILVASARYGDNERSCELTAWAAERFNNRTSAAVDVSNQICGDPAPTKRKELTVEYYCDGEMRTASAYEHRRLSISCY